MRSEARPLKAGLLWHSPNSGNLGVGALTIANIALVSQAAARTGRPVEFTIIGWIDQKAFYPQLQNVKAFALSGKQVLSPWGFSKAVSDCDFVIDIGAGDSFSDLYGLKRFAYLAATKAIAVALRKPLILAPQTIGPFDSGATRWVAERLISLSRITYARDPASAASVRYPRAQARISLATDVAFALPSVPTPKSSSKLRLGLNVSALLFNNGYSGTNEFGLRVNYADFVRRLIVEFRSMEDVEIILIPHVIAPGFPVEDDLGVCRRIAEDAGLTAPLEFLDPAAAKAYIASCDFFVGSRMHACIAAISSGIATVPVAYSRKFAGLFEGLEYRRTVDAREADTEAAVSKVLEHFRDRAAAASEARHAGNLARQKLQLYVESLADTIRSLKA